MRSFQSGSPTSIKLKALKNELNDLDEEIYTISAELNQPSRNQSTYYTPTRRTERSRSPKSYSSVGYSSSISNRKARTPNYQIDSTLHLNDLMSEDETDTEATRCYSLSYSQSSNNSPLSNKSRSISQCENSLNENRLYEESVAVLQKRTHNKYSTEVYDKKEDEFFFPKKKVDMNYIPISEPYRINEAQRNRKKVIIQHMKEKEEEFQNECTFIPEKVTPKTVITPEREYMIRNRKKRQNKEASMNTPKSIRFIDPNSAKIAQKSKNKTPIIQKRKIIINEAQTPPSKTLTKKQIQKSIERLSKPKQVSSEYDSESDDPDFEYVKKAKFADQKHIERLYEDSTKPKTPKNACENETIQKNFINPNSKKIAEQSPRNGDLFENSIQVAEEKYQRQLREKEYKKNQELSNCTFHPKINKNAPHFSQSANEYSTISRPARKSQIAMNNCYSKKYSNASLDAPCNTSYTTCHSISGNQSFKSSPSKSECSINSTPKKSFVVTKTKTSKISEESINDILSEVNSQMSVIWNPQDMIQI
ncbi:hypothetical protein TRFO_20977 [Tritrichomonas foetus]|uniref:Uncharacterized protein n=1 Tax=Tritrichomonas foetus TaxID=1144522 RepID=A0A1J4KJX2_9EUKA|nr:hypothetical protein TRFO_20977 [Tritrichomonas foetus]|eukprot:OHT09982.1 hypothetical protein TRFO_20977 [Tritrichomonas foetus]